MAIGTAAAIGLGVAGIGAAVSSGSANKATETAAQTSENNNAANTALAREIYGKNQQALSPFMDRGNAAGSQINALLGLGGGGVQQQQQAQQTQAAQVQPNALAQFAGRAGIPYGIGDDFIRTGELGANGFSYNALAPQTPQVPQGQTSQQAAQGAFDTFRNSTGYQFRLGEGMDALNSNFAGSGLVQSGARDRAAMEYGQNFASNEFGNYMGALQSQQAVGAGSASSLAGVGQNFAGTVIGANNQNAANQMNAQLAQGNNNVLGNVAGIIGGGILGGL